MVVLGGVAVAHERGTPVLEDRMLRSSPGRGAGTPRSPGRDQIVFLYFFDLHHKSSDSGERGNTLRTQERRFGPSPRAGGSQFKNNYFAEM